MLDAIAKPLRKETKKTYEVLATKFVVTWSLFSFIEQILGFVIPFFLSFLSHLLVAHRKKVEISFSDTL